VFVIVKVGVIPFKFEESIFEILFSIHQLDYMIKMDALKKMVCYDGRPLPVENFTGLTSL
jgi:hypothetical protein